MSKRFGRQQKRRMRAKLLALESGLALARSLGQRNARIVEDTARVLGKHFVTLDPAVIELRSLKHLGDWWEYHSKPPVFNPSSLASEFVERAIHRIPVLQCQALEDSLRSAVHYRFRFNGKEVGYALSQSAIMRSPGFEQIAAQNIPHAMTKLILDAEVKKK